MNARQTTEYGPLARFVIVVTDKQGTERQRFQPAFPPRGSADRADVLDAMRHDVRQWRRAGLTVSFVRA